MPTTPVIFKSPPSEAVAESLNRRSDARLEALSIPALADRVADTVYQERLRFEHDHPSEVELAVVEVAARAIANGGRTALMEATRGLVRSYTFEIHNRFSTRAYNAATKVLPKAMDRIVSASTPRQLVTGDKPLGSGRITIQGEIERVKELCERGTVILAPTHLSNLDSPLIGYALHRVGLPPFAYGAGLNLFSNPIMDFWMSRLGAYTVDRRKRGRIYKDTLKDYSVDTIQRGVHSLFFPGGTRSRSGRVEKTLKKGLLGTGITAWQQNIASGKPDGEVYVVPLTLSTSIVLEAETLIRDSLSAEGKQRYIIADDEFADARQVATFVGRILALDEAVHVTFGTPLDLVGNPIDPDGISRGPNGEALDRREYICDSDGQVQWDSQRDRVYTDRLSRSLVKAYHRDNVALETHVTAFAAWSVFQQANPGLDTWRLVRIERDRRRVERIGVLDRVERLMQALRKLNDEGRIRVRIGSDPAKIVNRAMEQFNRFHKRPALRPLGAALVVDPELLNFYQNRLTGYGLEEVV